MSQTEAPSATSVQRAVEIYYSAVCAMDVEAWVNNFAADAVDEEPGRPPMRGRDALRAFFLGLGNAFQSIDLRADHVFITGDTAAVKFTGRGKGRNGRDVTFEGIDVFEVNRDGRIQRMRAYWDPAAMFTQLG